MTTFSKMPKRRNAWRTLLRGAVIVAWVPCILSLMIFMGSFLGFAAHFTVENQSNGPVTVTPVGTVNQRGDRSPLPVLNRKYLNFRLSQRGGYEILPGESIEITYDMDDINFSEIVVYDRESVAGQLVVNPEPLKNQFSTPKETHFVVEDLDTLEKVPESVQKAADQAKTPVYTTAGLLGLLVGPWILLFLLAWLYDLVEKSEGRPETAGSGTV